MKRTQIEQIVRIGTDCRGEFQLALFYREKKSVRIRLICFIGVPKERTRIERIVRIGADCRSESKLALFFIGKKNR
jgi:hypothetical protein